MEENDAFNPGFAFHANRQIYNESRRHCNTYICMGFHEKIG